MSDPEVDPQQDVAMQIVASLCRAQIQGDHGEQYLDGLFNDPRDLKIIGSTALPALCVWVHSEQEKRWNSTQLVDEMLVLFDYIAPATKVETRDKNFPPLRHVWRSIREALHRGSHPSLNPPEWDETADADLMCAAGMDTMEGTAKVLKYGFLQAEAYPWFRGQMMISHIPDEGDYDALDDFLRMCTDFRQPGGDPYPSEIVDSYLVNGEPVIPPIDTPEVELLQGSLIVMSNNLKVIA